MFTQWIFFSAAYPQQKAHLHARGRRRCRIENIACIHQCANFSSLGGAGQREKQHTGSSRSGRAASRREAGTTAASFGMAPTRAKISAVERGEERGEKIKGRLMAVDEKTGEADILSHIVREHGAGSARASR